MSDTIALCLFVMTFCILILSPALTEYVIIPIIRELKRKNKDC